MGGLHRIRYTPEMDALILENGAKLELEELTKLFNSEFGTSVSKSGIKHRRQRLGIAISEPSAATEWSAEELDFVAQNWRTMTKTQLKDELLRGFGREVTASAICTLLYNRGWYKREVDHRYDWTPSMAECLGVLWSNGLSAKEAAEIINDAFDVDVSANAVSLQAYARFGSRADQHRYTKEEDEFLRDLPGDYDWKTVTEKFNERFNIQLDTASISDHGRRIGMSKDRTPSVGTEMSYLHRGRWETYVKVSENKGQRDNWKLKSHVVWEESFGPLDPEDDIIFLDGNPHNFEIANLKRVKRRYRLMVDYNGWRKSNDQQLLETGLKWAELQCNLIDAQEK